LPTPPPPTQSGPSSFGEEVGQRLVITTKRISWEPARLRPLELSGGGGGGGGGGGEERATTSHFI